MEIPTDIWLSIAQFIPDKTLRTMLGVNSVFYGLGMNIRYREISINSRDPLAKKTLSRLLDVEVAKRVRCLRLRLTHVKPHISRSPEETTSVGLLRQQFSSVLNRTFRSSGSSSIKTFISNAQSSSIQEEATLMAPISFKATIKALTAAFPGMVNVQELYIDSWDLPPQCDLHDFFTTAWSSFGHKLQKLWLSGSLEGYGLFIQSCSKGCLPSVEELCLEFTNNLQRVDDDGDGEILVNAVVPFINRLGPQLLSLRVWSWASLDLSSFFFKLPPLPTLHDLSLRMAFNRAFREDPSGLMQFIRRQSRTLQKLELRLKNPLGTIISPASEDPLYQWLNGCVSEEKFFSNIRAIDIYPTNLPTGIDILLSVIKQSSLNVKEFVVRDRYLHPEEVMPLLEALSSCRNLQYLRLNIWAFNVALFDTLAEKLPGLQRLWLYVGDAGIDEPEETFILNIQKRSYDQCKLNDIGIWKGGNKLDGRIMNMLAQSMPSVRSFWGNGDMALKELLS